MLDRPDRHCGLQSSSMVTAIPQATASDCRSAAVRVFALLPQLLTGLRLVSAPLMWWLVTSLELRAALLCLGLAMFSDAIDGSLVRRFGTPSRTGAYFDATADFAVIAAAFSAFAFIDIYPI